MTVLAIQKAGGHLEASRSNGVRKIFHLIVFQAHVYPPLVGYNLQGMRDSFVRCSLTTTLTATDGSGLTLASLSFQFPVVSITRAGSFLESENKGSSNRICSCKITK